MDSETDRLLVPYDEARHKLGGIGRTTMYELFERGELVRVNVGRPQPPALGFFGPTPVAQPPTALRFFDIGDDDEGNDSKSVVVQRHSSMNVVATQSLSC